jgi:dTDP-4-amino-4,6-dideoxygalactose transaminase
MRIWTRAQTIPGLRVPIPPAYIEHAAYKCYLFVRKEYLIREWNTLRIIDAIAEEEVPCFQGSCSEVYLEKAFENTAWRPQESLQVAKELGETSLTFLVHPTLSQKEIDITCSVLEKVMVKATGGAFCAESLEY